MDILEDDAAEPDQVDPETGEVLDEAILEDKRQQFVSVTFEELDYRQETRQVLPFLGQHEKVPVESRHGKTYRPSWAGCVSLLLVEFGNPRTETPAACAFDPGRVRYRGCVPSLRLFGCWRLLERGRQFVWLSSGYRNKFHDCSAADLQAFRDW